MNDLISAMDGAEQKRMIKDEKVQCQQKKVYIKPPQHNSTKQRPLETKIVKNVISIGQISIKKVTLNSHIAQMIVEKFQNTTWKAREIAGQIMMFAQQWLGGNWYCIVGKDIGFSIAAINEAVLYFTSNKTDFLIWTDISSTVTDRIDIVEM